MNTKKKHIKTSILKTIYILAAILGVIFFQSCTHKNNQQLGVNNEIVDNENPKNSINNHEYVDLGLSVKWATCNIGAESPSDIGNYYAWGEINTKSEYIEGNCQTFGKDIGSISGSSNYDVAYSSWEGTWRMPTKEEVEELLDKCEFNWITKDGHTGCEVTGPNGNSIFLPITGQRKGIALNPKRVKNGCYWCATPFSSKNDAYGLYFNSGYLGCTMDSRFLGQVVRPVAK